MIALLFSGVARADIGRFFDGRPGAAVLMAVRDHRTLAVYNEAIARSQLAPPGSALKPLVLATLLQNRKLTGAESLPCPGRLTIGRRSLAYSHPLVPMPLRTAEALAYSCNCF